MMRGQPLAVRLAVLLSVVVLVVLLAAGVVVNQVASRSIDETLSARDQQRLGLALAVLEDGIQRGAGPGNRGLGMLMRRVAQEAEGIIRLKAPDGSTVLEVGSLPPGTETQTLTSELSAAAGGGSLEVIVPNTQAAFLRAFNTALLITGIVAVVALLAGAMVIASRLTSPLRAVTHAAERLEAGDLSARARGGPDAESAELATAFNAMAERVERSEGLRRRAASDLAHDLATPATVLESQLQAMTDGVVPADGEQLERARAAAAALSGVILQLGELTRAESAPLQRHPDEVNLRALASDIVAALDGLFREREVTGHVEGPSVRVTADPGQLSRALRNVVTNAIQHSAPGSEVLVATVVEADQAVVRIMDHGPGIADADLPYVFERFYRADRSRGGSRTGSGIGLTVARELIGANGGDIEVEATGPNGTTFRISLPRTG
jgi:two-component system sensor histidine kinase BaeS